MSTASRNCGMAGGTCGRVDTQHSAPGAKGGTRGHYDLRAERHAGCSEGTSGKRLPRATNAAPPRKRAGAFPNQGALPALRSETPVRRAPRANFLAIALREPRLRHSPSPAARRARGDIRGRGPP